MSDSNVTLNKKDRFQWNKISQNQNTKFMAVNQKFEGRSEIPKF